MKRPVAWAALGLGLGICACVFGNGVRGLIVLVPVLMLELLALLWSRDYIKGVGVLSAFMLAGFLIMQINLQVYHAHDYSNAHVQIVAVQTDTDGILRDLVIDGKHENGRMLLPEEYSLKNNKEPKPGDVVRFNCRLGDVQIDRDGIQTTQYKDGIRYYATEMESEIEVLERGSPAFDETVRLYIKDMLFNYLGEQNGAVAYAMTVGDTSYMDKQTLGYFRSTGTAHIFAVSGLHVGFVVMLINAAVRKRKKLAFALTVPITLFYAYICGFSPSILRASLMTWLLLAVKISGREPDFLSSIASAALVILAISPFYLFDAGFQMSVGSVLGICFVTATLQRKICGKSKIASAMAVSIGATLGTAPFALQYFQGVSVIGVLFNVVAVPVIEIVYMATILCLIIPVLFFVFPAINFVLNLVTNVAAALSPAGMIAPAKLGYGILPYFMLLYAASGTLNTELKARLCFAVMNCLLIICVCIMPPARYDGINYCYTSGMTLCAVTAEGENYIFTELSSYDDYLEAEKFADDNLTLYITDYDAMRKDLVLLLAQNSRVQLKCLSKITNNEKYYDLRRQGVLIMRVHDEDNGDVKINTLEYISKMLAIRVEVCGCSFAYLPELTGFQKGFVLQFLEPCDAYLCENACKEVKEMYPQSYVFTTQYEVEEGIYSTVVTGDFTFKCFDGKMIFVQ